MKLLPFPDETELDTVTHRCHTLLWERHGYDPAQAFDEFSKLLFTRFYDETKSTPPLQSIIQFGESPVSFASRVKAIFREATKRHKGIFVGESSRIRADDFAIYQVFQALAEYSVSGTNTNGFDVKGTVYEKVIGNTFRGELGQFFTHRHIVDFMVRMIRPEQSEIVYDPSCGSAGFLIASARIQSEGISKKKLSEKRLLDYSKHFLVGSEINERTARTAKLNMLMHGLDYSGIHNINALKAESSDLCKRISPGMVDIVLANPPFAGLEKDEDILEKFDLSNGRFGKTTAVTREVLFLELIVKLLKEGGRAGIVVPQGILSNSKLAYVREYLRRNAEILAVVELPDWAFIPSGTSVRGSLLFIKRTSKPPSGYGVYMTKVGHIGFTSTGRADVRNEFPSELKDYEEHARSKIVPIADLQLRFDAKFHIEHNRKLLEAFEKNPVYKLVPLRAIGSFNVERYSPKSLPHVDLPLVEIGDIDIMGQNIRPTIVEGRACNYSSLKKAIPGDIVISRRRAYRGAIVRVPRDLGEIFVIPEFSVLRLHQGIDPEYVLSVLQSKQFTELMTVYSTGEMSSRISERDLQELKIPLPDNNTEIGAALRKMRDEIEGHYSAIASLKRLKENTIMQILQGTKTG